jgi:hypothetical protein
MLPASVDRITTRLAPNEKNQQHHHSDAALVKWSFSRRLGRKVSHSNLSRCVSGTNAARAILMWLLGCFLLASCVIALFGWLGERLGSRGAQ